MSPRRFDPEVVDEKLRLMEPLLQVLEDLGPLSRQRLENEHLTRLATERILTQLVDLASSANAHIAGARLGRIPKDYHESFHLAAEAGAIPTKLAKTLAPSAGLRNRLVRQYEDTDLGKIADFSPHALTDYRAYIGAVTAWLQRVDP